MATKKICDRCGAEINPRESLVNLELTDYRGNFKSKLELCVSCSFRLGKWLEQKDGAENG